MRIPARGVGQSNPFVPTGINVPASCGEDPCTWSDAIWSSDACDQYLACAGAPPLTFSGQLGEGFKEIFSGTASVAGQAAQGALSNTTTDAVLVVGGIILVMVFLMVEKL